MKQLITVTISFVADDANIADVLETLKEDGNTEFSSFRDLIDDVANSAFVQVESLTDDFGISYEKAELDVKVQKVGG